MIYQRVAPIALDPHTLLAAAMEEVVMDTALGGTWVNMTSRLVSRTGVNGSTPGETFNTVSVENDPSIVLIGIVATYSPCGLSGILKVLNKWQSMSPGLGGNTPKLDAAVDRKLPDDLDYASIYSKVIGHKLSDGSSDDLYLRCRMNFAGDVVQTQATKFMDLGLPDINILNEIGFLGTTANSI